MDVRNSADSLTFVQRSLGRRVCTRPQMNPIDVALVGVPCGRRGSYSFYKSASYTKNDERRCISIGQFFYLRISATEVCVCQLQLLWKDRNRRLSASSLYFPPHNAIDTYEQDEVFVMSEKAVLLLDHLVEGIVEDEDESNTQQNLLENGEKEKESSSSSSSPVIVMSYPNYCRYRAMQKRLESSPGMEKWFADSVVQMLTGVTKPVGSRQKVFFCRDTVDRPDLERDEKFCNHLTPNLKGLLSGRKKRFKVSGRHSPSSESNTSEENGRVTLKIRATNHKNGVHVKTPEGQQEEQEFLDELFLFMRERKTPIERVPHLGFKQINLYLFYNYARNLGGYEKITNKKLWKQIYDVLGGSPGSTSAATCTRRHYERLLLPYERHERGEDHKPLPIAAPTTQRRHPSLLKQSKRDKQLIATSKLRQQTYSSVDDTNQRTNPQSPVDGSSFCTVSSVTSPGDPEDSQPSVGTGTAPTVEVKPEPTSTTPPPPQPQEQQQRFLEPLRLRSESPEHPLVSPPTIIERPCTPGLDVVVLDLAEPAGKEDEWEEKRRKNAQPKQRLKDDQLAAKERQWDEIRRQNAIERDRVRQMTGRGPNTGRRGTEPFIEALVPKPVDGGGIAHPQRPMTAPIRFTQSPMSDIRDQASVPIPAQSYHPSTTPNTHSAAPPLVDLTRVVNALPLTVETAASTGSGMNSQSVVRHDSFRRTEDVENVHPNALVNIGGADNLVALTMESNRLTNKPAGVSLRDNNRHGSPIGHVSQLDKMRARSRQPIVRTSTPQPPPQMTSQIMPQPGMQAIVTARPSVIQHTPKPHVTAPESSYYHYPVVPSTTSSWQTPPTLYSPTDRYQRPAPAQYYYQYAPVAPDPSRTTPGPITKKPRVDHPMLPHPQYYPSPKTFDRDTTRTTWHAHSSPRTSTTTATSQTAIASQTASQDEVLDLSIKKPRKEEVPPAKPPVVRQVQYIEDVAEYERITPPEKELDLSIKNKSTSSHIVTTSSPLYTTSSSSSSTARRDHHHHHQQQQQQQQQQPSYSVMPLYPSRQDGSVVCDVYVDGRRGPRTGQLPKPEGTTESTNVVGVSDGKRPSPNHSCLTVSCTPLSRKQQQSYFSPHQLPGPYYTSSMYAFPTPFLSNSPGQYLSTDQLQASFTAYKDVFHHNMYAASPYPYPTAPPLYEHLYKENQPYFFPPK